MKNQTLNILIVAAWYPSHKNPTEGSFIEEQVEMLQKLGHKITVLHPYLLGTFRESFNKNNYTHKETWKACEVIRIGVKPLIPGCRTLAYKYLLYKTKKALEKYSICIHDFDIIHSHALFMGGYIGLKLSQKYQIPFVHTEHTSGLIAQPEQYSKADRKIIQEVLLNASKTLFVSKFALEKTLIQYSISPSSNIEVLNNIVASVFFEVEINHFESNPFRYLVISRLHSRKGNELLLQGWKEVVKLYPRAQLTIAGEGPEKEKLIGITQTLNLKDSVIFLPHLSRTEVLKQIKQHHVLISVSRLETFGLTVAEAQAIGKPVVVTDSGGVRDIVTKETGIICESHVNELAKALIEIQVNYEKYDPHKIRELTYNKFSESVIGLQLEKIYSEILNQN